VLVWVEKHREMGIAHLKLGAEPRRNGCASTPRFGPCDSVRGCHNRILDRTPPRQRLATDRHCMVEAAYHPACLHLV
jgi:hypothetical protein